MAKRTQSRGISRSSASRPMGAVQTLGGRRRGGIRDVAGTCDGSGRTRALTTSRCKSASATGGDSGWKHLTRQVPKSGQTFCGQSGHGFAGLWQGISSIDAVVAVFAPAIANA